MAKRTYHHGDLRRALLTAAIEVINESGPAGLSLRDLARRADVSHAAPTHHFRDKAGLLTALAAEGYRLLADELAATHRTAAPVSSAGSEPGAVSGAARAGEAKGGTAPTGSAQTGSKSSDNDHFLELGVAYVRFATGHRAHFEVMFRPELYHAHDPGLVVARQRAAEALATGVAALPEVASGRDARDAGLAAWSIAHGFAMLWLSGSLPDLGPDLEAAARTVLRHLRSENP